MAWEMGAMRRTLFLEEFSRNGRKFYTVYPLMRLTTPKGETFLEPLPSQFLMQQKDVLRFDDVQFIGEARIDRKEGAGDLNLNAVCVREGVRRID